MELDHKMVNLSISNAIADKMPSKVVWWGCLNHRVSKMTKSQLAGSQRLIPGMVKPRERIQVSIQVSIKNRIFINLFSISGNHFIVINHNQLLSQPAQYPRIYLVY